MFRVHNKNNIFIVNFEHISHLFLEFLLLILSKQMLAGQCLNEYLQNQCGRTFSYNFFRSTRKIRTWKNMFGNHAVARLT